MSNILETLNHVGYDITKKDFERLRTSHPYIGEKLILDLVNGINVVARDLNDTSKTKEKGISRIWDDISGNAKKRQNLINENAIEGLHTVSEWLTDHNRHLGRVDQRIKDVADELYHTQDEILKFYEEFKEVDFRVEILEKFRESATNRLNGIENRLTKVEAQQHIDREILKIGTLNLPIELEIFTILDNLASGEAGLYYFQEKNTQQKNEFLLYIKNSLKKKISSEDLQRVIEHQKFIDQFHKLEAIEKKAIGFISSQYNTFLSDNSYDMTELVHITSTYSSENAENEIDKRSNIRTFVTLETFVEDITEELFNIDIYENISPIVEETNDVHEELKFTNKINNNYKNILNQHTKLGVVLSGGGAKGAYEAGFLKALDEFNIQPKAIAGTSIGALNGAIYSAKKDTKTSAKLIRELWQELGNDGVLEVDKTKAVKNLIEVFSYFAPMPVSRLSKIAMASLRAGKSSEGVLTQLPIINRLQEHAPVEELQIGLPFYVGMTKAKGNGQDLLNFVGFGQEDAVFKKIQELKEDDMHKAIMASAALPILFDGLELEGETYRDGCLGSTDNEWGNTPAKPLIENEGCTHVIICHLNEGSFFNRHDPLFKNTSIIEIRPTHGTFSSGLDPLQFSVDKIDIWMKQGYEDTKRILREASNALLANNERILSEEQSKNAVDRLKSRNFSLSNK